MNDISKLIEERNKIYLRLDEINDEIVNLSCKKYNIGQCFKEREFCTDKFYKITDVSQSKLNLIIICSDCIRESINLPKSYIANATEITNEEFMSQYNIFFTKINNKING